ncbi:MAG TPA: recombinase family protein [Streptosporangiaceae bacterium]
MSRWQPLQHSTVLHVLHNLRYAGAFTYGRHREQLLPGGKRASITVPREEWISFLPGAHTGYITLDQWEANIAKSLRRGAVCNPRFGSWAARWGLHHLDPGSGQHGVER